MKKGIYSHIPEELGRSGIVPFTETVNIHNRATVAGQGVTVKCKIKNFRYIHDIYINHSKSPVMTVIDDGVDSMNDDLALALPDLDKQSIGEIFNHVKKTIDEVGKKDIKYTAPNSYFFNLNGRNYLLESSTTKIRVHELKSFLSAHSGFDILLSHFHPDHVNNNGAIARKDTKIFLHHRSRDNINGAWGYYRFLYRHFHEVCKFFFLPPILRRVLRLPDPAVSVLTVLADHAPGLLAFFIVLFNIKLTGLTWPSKKNFFVLDEASKKTLSLGKKRIDFQGWIIGEHIAALETPIHTYDHISYYVKPLKLLFIGDNNVFINPNNYFENTLDMAYSNLKKTIDLIKTENIEVLLSSHSAPVIGRKNVLHYISQYEKKMHDVYRIIEKIITGRTRWHWDELLSIVYSSPEPIIQELIKINWPKTFSNIDMYMALLLTDLGYVMVDYRKSVWEKK